MTACAGLLAFAVIYRPEPSLASNGRDAAVAMGRLFSESCLRFAGDTAGLRSILSAPQFRPIPPSVAHMMLPKPGQAFELPQAPGHLMVLSFDDGWCADSGTGLDPSALTNALSEAVGAVLPGAPNGTSGGVMKLMGADPAGREQRYLIERPDQLPVVLLVLLRPADTASGGPTLTQASLFASPMRPESEAAP